MDSIAYRSLWTLTSVPSWENAVRSEARREKEAFFLQRRPGRGRDSHFREALEQKMAMAIPSLPRCSSVLTLRRRVVIERRIERLVCPLSSLFSLSPGRFRKAVRFKSILEVLNMYNQRGRGHVPWGALGCRYFCGSAAGRGRSARVSSCPRIVFETKEDVRRRDLVNESPS